MNSKNKVRNTEITRLCISKWHKCLNIFTSKVFLHPGEYQESVDRIQQQVRTCCSPGTLRMRLGWREPSFPSPCTCTEHTCVAALESESRVIQLKPVPNTILDMNSKETRQKHDIMYNSCAIRADRSTTVCNRGKLGGSGAQCMRAVYHFSTGVQAVLRILILIFAV